MQQRRIGRSALTVSDFCLGTMTFGASCDEAEAHRILDAAVERGIDFLDTAEIYAIPPCPEHVFRTEEIMGRWLVRQNRDAIIVATKFCGSASSWFTPPVRGGKTALDRRQIRQAVEGSLRRLQTDYIDLYQTHWPDHDFPYEQTLEALDELVQQGVVRVLGCSNESAWGLMKSLAVAERYGFARYESIQNNFSLLNRRFEDALAEVCRREQVSLLPYSPLGGGVLTGKYNTDPTPATARFSWYARDWGPRQQAMAKRFVNEKSLALTAKLTELATDIGLTPAALALAWSRQHDFVASTVFGVNTVAQFEQLAPAFDTTLSDEVLQRINTLCAEFPYALG